ncbi:Bifunctional protein GlmU [uncultured archaeon]|nr:Bifunctional protein GlmU [uncultured archaeon]
MDWFVEYDNSIYPVKLIQNWIRMKTCIMCGGEGTRLRPLTFDRPKPMIPLLNKPSVVHLVEHLAMEGFNDIVVTLGYLGGEIEAALGDGSMYGVHIEYVHEQEKLGTAGGVKNAEELFEGEPFMVVGGDHVMNLGLREFYRFHEKNDALVTIGLIPIDDPREYGIADMNVNNRITRFFEKPAPGEIFSNLASTGIYVCDPEVLDWVPKKKYDFAKDLFPDVMEKGENINGFLVHGRWTDIGNPQAYREACRWMLEQMPGTKISGRFNIKDAKVTGPVDIGHDVSLGSNSAIVGPIVIGENTSIGDNVLIGPYTSIGSNCNIGNNSRILSSYIFDGVEIGLNTVVSGAVIDNNTRIKETCILETGTVIGPRVMIDDKVTVNSLVRIWPEVSVKRNTKVCDNIGNDCFGTETNGS